MHSPLALADATANTALTGCRTLYRNAAVGPTTLSTKDDYKTVENLWCVQPTVGSSPQAAGSASALEHLRVTLVTTLWCRCHNTRWYAVMDRKDFDQYNSTFTDIVFSQNMGISKLPVKDVSAYLDNLHAAWVNGTTLWLDYSFPAFPENIGHWLEMLLPVYSQLSIGAWKEHVPPGEEPVISACILPNLRRGQVQVCRCYLLVATNNATAQCTRLSAAVEARLAVAVQVGFASGQQ